MSSTANRVRTLEEVIASFVSESYCPAEVLADAVRRWITQNQAQLRDDANSWYAQGWHDLADVLTTKDTT